MSRKILLADDSLTIQKVVELTFMEGDFDVAAVSNGDDALSHLDQDRPDMVIADVHMPGADGYQICKITKEAHPGVPVLLLVGTFEPFEESVAKECGADGHLKKPFDSQELLNLVEELLQGSNGGGVAEESSDPEAEAATQVEVELGGGEGSFEIPAAVEVASPAPLEDVIPDTVSTPEVAVDEIAPAESSALSDQDVDRIARRVVELIGDETIREISWDVIPDMAEIVIKDRIRELESEPE